MASVIGFASTIRRSTADRSPGDGSSSRGARAFVGVRAGSGPASPERSTKRDRNGMAIWSLGG